MALTRKLLNGMGLTDEQVDTIIEAHAETVEGLKAEADKYKGDAEKLPGVQKELDDLKAAWDGGYKEKYEKEHQAFEDFKKDQSAKDTRQAKEKAYRTLLREAGISDKRLDSVLKVSDVDSVELDENGAVKDADKLMETVKADWSDFIVTNTMAGAPTANPPANTGGGTMSKEDIMKIKDAGERQRAIAENHTLFGF